MRSAARFSLNSKSAPQQQHCRLPVPKLRIQHVCRVAIQQLPPTVQEAVAAVKESNSSAHTAGSNRSSTLLHPQQQHSPTPSKPASVAPANSSITTTPATSSNATASNGGSMGNKKSPSTSEVALTQPTTSTTPSIATTTSSSSSGIRDEFGPPAWAPQPVVNFVRSTEFFARVAHIYGAYKVTQLRAGLMRAQGRSEADITDELWDSQHTWAGQQMYDLCISLRGFYLKAGQFIGARADFVPEQICRKLCLLQDQVPPMSAGRAKQVVCSELGIDDLSEVFEWIDLQEPIGSASVSQVHKAQLRRFPRDQLRHLARREGGTTASLAVTPGDTAWGICNSHGISLAELAASNRDVDLDHLQPGQVLRVPVVLGLEHFQQQQQQQQQRAAAGVGDGGWLGLGRVLGSTQSLTNSSSSSSSRPSGRLSEEVQVQGYSSSSSSSSEEWLEPGSSMLAAGDSWQQQLANKREHLLQLVAAHRGSIGSSGSSGSFRGTSFSRVLGASEEPEAEVNPRSSSRNSHNTSSSQGALPPMHSPAAAAVAHAAAAGQIPDGGLVAVKIQYPGALQTMSLDLVNLRSVSAFLQKTELKFDLLSAVEELQKQIHLEFDFMREARVMDTIAQHLSPLAHRVAVPRSVPGLVSQRLMVMSFMEGTPLMQLRDKVAHLPKWKRDKAARHILAQVSQAYGLMILGEGLFQADGHPGNILVQRGGRVALLDYGQSKQLEDVDKLAFADLILAMNREDKRAISDALWRLNVLTTKDDASLRADMAYGMFDTRGKVDPFDPNSPIKQAAVEKFPPDMFFVLRVVQLLRGMANGMGIEDFSTAEQWAPLARQTMAKAQKKQRRRQAAQAWRAQPLFDLAALATPLKLTV